MPSTTPVSATAPSTAVSTVVAMMIVTGMNAKTAHALCTNECTYPSDGDCDDGGPDHDFSFCAYGSDCDDCGVRCDSGQIVDPVSGQCVNCGNAEEGDQTGVCIPCGRPNAITFDTTTSGCVITECEPGYHIRTGGAYCDSVPEGPGCGHTCEYADNGECDDGGSGSYWSDCEIGSDCSDCGLRCVDGQIMDPASGQCGTCPNAEEPNLAYDACVPCERHNATEFADAPGCVITQCDPQYELHIRTGGQYCDPIQEGPGCGHTCKHVDDGTCDDGGEGSTWDDCEYGSDCRDCGERETMDCPNKTEFHHNKTAAWCEPCQRENALGFEDVAGSCVISTCVEGFHHNMNSSTCDVYKEGHGCDNGCEYSRDGVCDDGSDGEYTWCALGTDCEDCGLQCGHAHEEHEGACVVCERPGAAHFEDVEGCVIANCSDGNNLTNAGVCEAIPGLCYLDRPGYEITAEGVCAECDVPHALSYVAGVNGCEVESCGSGFKLAGAVCVADTPEPTPVPPTTAPTAAGVSGCDRAVDATCRDLDVAVGNADAEDDGFNPLWLLLLLIPVSVLGAVGAYFLTKKKGGSAARSEDDASKGLNNLVEGQFEAPLLPEPEVEADGEVQQANAESEEDTMDL